MIRVSHTHQVRLSVCAQCSEQLRELHKMQSLTHTHQVRLSVCALCREQLRELHQMQEHGMEEEGREVLPAGLAEEPGSDDRCFFQPLEKKRKEKTMPFGVNLMRRQVLRCATQGLKDLCSICPFYSEKSKPETPGDSTNAFPGWGDV